MNSPRRRWGHAITNGYQTLDAPTHLKRSDGMDSQSNNHHLRSVPLIQGGDMGQRGDASARQASAGRDAAPSRRRASASSVDATAKRPRATHVSAYPGESTAGEATARSARRARRADAQRSTEQRDGRRTTGFSLVADETSHAPRAERPERAQRGGRADERRTTFAADYEYETGGLSGAQSRRNAIIDALCIVPETIGEAVLGLLARIRAGGVLACALIVITVLMLYAPVRDIYVTNRKLDALQATYDALLAENDSIRSELEFLQTREGIENEARARGYVEPGETKVVVNGLTEEELEALAAEAEDVEVTDTRPWYTRVLDAIFGYEPEG